MSVGFSQEAKNRHLKLMTDISNYIAPLVDEYRYKQCKNRLRGFLNPLEQKESHDIMDILEIMEKRGKVGIGRYDAIKDILKNDFNVELGEMVDQAVIDIQQLQEQHQQSHTVAADALNSRHNDSGIGTKRSSADSDKTIPKKVKRKEKPGYSRDNKQKGLMVILNFKKERPGSGQDVHKITDLFEGELKFEMDIEMDLTKAELFDCLDSIQKKLKRKAKQYYCFFMVLMSHGDKHGILTSDEEQTYVNFDDIFAYFKNDVIGEFAGKPRVFLVQSCRGDKEQGTVDVSDDTPINLSDYVGKVTIPTDSDILVAYATTPGNQAYRRLPFPGAWFIDALASVFGQDYKEDHLEEMLISVREKVALDPEYRTNTNKCQMPCVWTTLTKRLFLQ